MPNIRRAAAEDAGTLHRFIEALEGAAIDRWRFDELYFENLRSEDIVYLLALEAGEPVGFASLHVQRLLHHAAKIAEIQEIYVDPAYRKLGIGRALFQAARQEAEGRGCAQLEVCCNQVRKGSHVFYERQGMRNTHYKFTLPMWKSVKTP
ncbi:MAG TPA: GNAT family N-acetyltransferase [Clostridia bacterium]|nr:GNAT family N-acetyltransferase [Clostridia bacterium]